MNRIIAWLGLALLVSVMAKKAIELFYPVRSKVLSRFGMRKHPVTGEVKLHNGVDFSGKIGDAIVAPASGTVALLNKTAAGGLQLFIRHDNGYITGYAHLNKYLVQLGQRVRRGQPIAELGRSGQVTGPHLHFTVKDEQGNYIDPLTILKA